MSGWLSKAANVFKPEIPEAPQPFILLCFCGEEIRGLRRAEHQRIVCKVCGTPLFILPRDVYPAAPATPEKSEMESPRVPVTVLVEEALPIEEKPASVRSGAKSKSSRRVKEEIPQADHLPTLAELRQRIRDAEKPKVPVQVAAAVPEKVSVIGSVGTSIGEIGAEARKEFVRFWSPFRILALVVVLVMLATGGFTLRQSLLARAVKIAKQEGELGLAAIEQSEWVVARDHLQRAAAALDQLGRTDPDAQKIRQYARETQAQFRLSDLTLEDLLKRAQSELRSRDEKDKSRNKLASAYYGDWMLFEAVVKDVSPEKSRKRSFAITLPIGPDGNSGKTIIRTDFSIFNQLIPTGGEKAVIVAGAIADCEESEDGSWIITLDPKSGFLWSHLNTYRAIGFDFNPLRTQAAVESELSEQAHVMGVPE